MEEVGIYYFFEHTADAHTLVLVDDQVAHQPMPGYAEVPFYPPNTRVDEYFDHWTSTAEVQSGGFVLDDYNFETPAATLLVERSDPRAHSNADLTQYEYPGGYEVAGDGNELVRVRLEEQQAEFERYQGDASCRGLAAGHTFTLTKYPRADQNESYLAIAAGYTVASESYESQRIAGPREDFRCSVTALDAKVAFRPLRSTPRPRMSGPQTATVSVQPARRSGRTSTAASGCNFTGTGKGNRTRRAPAGCASGRSGPEAASASVRPRWPSRNERLRCTSAGSSSSTDDQRR